MSEKQNPEKNPKTNHGVDPHACPKALNGTEMLVLHRLLLRAAQHRQLVISNSRHLHNGMTHDGEGPAVGEHATPVYHTWSIPVVRRSPETIDIQIAKDGLAEMISHLIKHS